MHSHLHVLLVQRLQKAIFGLAQTSNYKLCPRGTSGTAKVIASFSLLASLVPVFAQVFTEK